MPEDIIWKGRPSQVVNLGPFAVALLVAVAVAVGAVFFTPLWIALVLPLGWAAWKWLVVRCRVYELTSQRLRLYRGVLNQRIDEIELYRVKDTVIERPLWLRIFRGELEDILTNVLRNSLQASLDAGAPRMGLRVETEEDWITGLERVAFRVMDDAPRRITTALIRSRYIERGLGLTVDLISRNGGSIHVEDEPEWSKAVVVRLTLAEPPADDDEDEGVI